MKRLITLLLTICVMITSISIITANAEEPEYTYNEKTRTLTINYFNGSEPWAEKRNNKYPFYCVRIFKRR